ncbi:hypothetical protein CC80DRAFT_519958 [Byssothecium circinans]|uniref:Uncharacterized protein n=1 Tax=Byssothecium circinans TaxID=147558 RepID=A0A6A5TFZ4_9PLEO|nr:hypothetical protein CC80DRAFT_519958 [Byssothecium circinans]
MTTVAGLPTLCHDSEGADHVGATILPHKPGRMREMVKTLSKAGADTIRLVPPAHEEKFDICVELVNAAKKANVQNVLLINSVGCGLAERDKQPRLREFVDIKTLVFSAKGDSSTSTGHSPCVIRAGFCAENLLLYSPRARNDGTVPSQVDQDHKFAPVALGDVALLAAHVLSRKGQHGFDDKHRGQLMVLTGPILATAASKALDMEMTAKAKKVLQTQSSSDESEKQCLLEYYSPVPERKTNYNSTTAFVNVMGQHPQEG